MITKSKQIWAVGQTVKVGFIAGLTVLAVVATPGDYLPDSYLLARNGKFYTFIPHNGLSSIDESEACDMSALANRQIEEAAAAAIAKAGASSRYAALVADLTVG